MAISVSIICYNEEKKIRRCLESVKWADEIVVLDSFSTDATQDICREYTDKIHQHEFDGHIQQKNRAIDLCSNDWVFCIDADEVVTDELKDSILKTDTGKTEFYGFAVPRKVFYLGKWISHGGWYPDYKIRFFNRKFGKWGGVNPHDTVIVQGKTSFLKGDLQHYSYENISAHLTQVNKFTDIMAREYEALDKKPSVLNLTIRPFYKFFKMYFLKLGFLDGRRGFIIAVIASFYVFMKFVKLFERKLK
ncbi:MAG: glycosyltransferase family 2 protein [Spirochaetes bacterium]|nr:glycosyltransferase family 2 protein [Spirochaetota bacterium]